MKIKNIQKIRRININQIDYLANSFISYLYNDCTEPFRVRVVNYYGDNDCGKIYIKSLRDFLNDADFGDISKEIIGSLARFCEIAEFNKIDEIILN